tara:strand:+ start:7125 stop:7934 length:810 start_codon:yes stop_codon:yes gene_type:complete
MEQELYTKVNKVAALCLSGGMDSTSLLLKLLKKNYKIFAISYDYGQKHKIEIQKAKKNIQYLQSKKCDINHKIIDISDCVTLLSSSITNDNIEVPEGYYEEDNMKSTFVPNRNAIFSSILYGYAITLSKKIKTKILISLGVHSGDHAIYPDCREGFYKKLFKAFSEGNWDSDKVELLLPYLKLDKSQILLDAQKSCQKLDISFNTIFKNTITSYSPNEDGISSGKSGSDIERILAFNKLGLKDPIDYIESWDIVLKNAIKIEENFKKIN